MLSGNIRTFVRPRRHFQPKQKATNGTAMSLASMEYFFFLPVAFALYWAVPARKNTLRNALLGLFRHRCRYGKTVRTADAPQLCLSQQSDLSSTVPPHQVRCRRGHTKNNQAVEIAVVMFLQRQRTCLSITNVQPRLVLIRCPMGSVADSIGTNVRRTSGSTTFF